MRKTKKQVCRSMLCVILMLCMILPIVCSGAVLSAENKDNLGVTEEISAAEEPDVIEENTEPPVPGSTGEDETDVNPADEEELYEKNANSGTEENTDGSEDPTESSDWDVPDEMTGDDAVSENSLISMPPIVVTGANAYTPSDAWKAEERGGAFNNALGKPIVKSGSGEPARINFSVYIPEDGYYYVSGRALTQKGTSTDKWLNRTFWVAFVQNGITRFLTGSDPIEGREDDDFDSYTAEDGQNRYLFGARREETGALGYYEYVDADPIYLEKGENTLSVFGYSFARMDYLAITKTRQVPCGTKEKYDFKYGKYETTAISLSAQAERNRVTLEIENSSGKGTDGFNIYRSTPENEREFVTKIAGTDTTYTDYVALNNTEITYWVETTDSNMTALQSNSETVNIAVSDLKDPVVLTGWSFHSAPGWEWDTTANIQESAFNSMGCFYTTLLTYRYKTGTVNLYIPESGYYYIYGRMCTKSDNGADRTITVSVAQGREERQITGRNSFGEPYRFGGNECPVNSLAAYSYCNSEPIYLEKGPAALHIRGFNYARMDYLAIGQDIICPLTKAEYDEVLLPHEFSCPAGGMAFETEPTVKWTGIGKIVVDGGNVGFLAYGIDEEDDKVYLGSTNTRFLEIESEKLGDFKQLYLLYLTENSNFDERYIDFSEFTYENFVAVFTGKSGFETVMDAESYQTIEWKSEDLTGDAYNHSTGKYYTPGKLLTAEESPTGIAPLGAFLKKEIYIPEDGTYYVYGRAACNPFEPTGVGRNYTFKVSFNGMAVEGTDEMIGDLDPDFDSVRGNGYILNYLFGARRSYMTGYKGYSYTDAQPITLQKGFYLLEIKGFNYAALDFLVVSNLPPVQNITKKYYDSFLAKYEDLEAPVFTEEVQAESTGLGSYRLSFKASDNIAIAGYKIMQVNTGGENVVLADVSGTETHANISGVMGGPWASLQIEAYDYCGNTCFSNIVTVNNANYQYDPSVIILSCGTRFLNNAEDAEKNKYTIWRHEAEPVFTPYVSRDEKGVFNTTGMYLRTTELQSLPARTEFKVYVPTGGTYHIGARALSRKGGEEDVWLNRCFAIRVNNGVVVSSGKRKYFSDNENDFDTYTVREGERFDYSMWDIDGGYMFGARNPNISELRFYNYMAGTVYLQAGENTITLYGMPLAGFDYIVLSKEEITMPENRYVYERELKKYEDITPPGYAEYPHVVNETYSYIDIAFKAFDYDTKVLRSEIYYVHKGEETLLGTVDGDATGYRISNVSEISENEFIVKTYDYFGNVAIGYCDNENTDRKALIGRTVKGSIDYDSDKDYYALTVDESGRYMLSSAADLKEVTVLILDSEGNPVNRYGLFTYNGTDDLRYNKLLVDLEKGKTYLLVVSGKTGSEYTISLLCDYKYSEMDITCAKDGECIVVIAPDRAYKYGIYTFKYDTQMFELLDMAAREPGGLKSRGTAGDYRAEYVTSGHVVMHTKNNVPILLRLKAKKEGTSMVISDWAYLPE